MRIRVMFVIAIFLFVFGCSSTDYGNSPEEAVNKTGRKIEEVLYKESVKDGVVIFFKKEVSNGTTYAAGYVRKSIMGWKWIWGGEYSGYAHQYFPYVKGTPFPLIFGDIEGNQFSKVYIEDVKSRVKHNAKLIKNDQNVLWFTFLNKSDNPSNLRVVWLTVKDEITKTEWINK